MPGKLQMLPTYCCERMTERDIFLAAHLYLQYPAMMQVPLVMHPIASHIHLSKLHLIMPTVTRTVSLSTFRFLPLLCFHFFKLESPLKLLVRWGCQCFLYEDRNSSKQNTWWQHQFKQLVLLAVLPHRSQIWPLEYFMCFFFFFWLRWFLSSYPKSNMHTRQMGTDKICFPFCVYVQWTSVTVNVREAGIKEKMDQCSIKGCRRISAIVKQGIWQDNNSSFETKKNKSIILYC